MPEEARRARAVTLSAEELPDVGQVLPEAEHEHRADEEAEQPCDHADRRVDREVLTSIS